MSTETRERRRLKPSELKREVAREIRRRLWEQIRGDRELERWFYDIEKFHTMELAEKLVDTSGSREELEQSVRRVVEALPRYARLVRRVLDIREPFWYVTREVPREAVRIFKSLAPLSSELRETGFELLGYPVYVGEWIQVQRFNYLEDIESVLNVNPTLNELRAVEFIAKHGKEIAKHVEDEEKREVFLRLVELARGLIVRPSGVCAGEVSTYGYYPSIQRYVLYELRGMLCADDTYPGYVRVGERELSLYPSNLPSLIPIMDKVEELYDRLVEALRDAAEHNRRVLEEMRRVARPYIVARILG